MFKKGDKIIFVFLAVLVLGWLVFQFFVDQGPVNARSVEIKIDGELYKRIPLNEIANEQIIHIDNHYGINDVKITKDGAEVIYADCPDQVCVRTGKISKVGPIIACLPHKLSVEIVSESESEDDLDAISQ